MMRKTFTRFNKLKRYFSNNKKEENFKFLFLNNEETPKRETERPRRTRRKQRYSRDGDNRAPKVNEKKEVKGDFKLLFNSEATTQ
jgi:hypothetical protein